MEVRGARGLAMAREWNIEAAIAGAMVVTRAASMMHSLMFDQGARGADISSRSAQLLKT
jgi:hypothetical protein